jgi:subtilisin family serine protease
MQQRRIVQALGLGLGMMIAAGTAMAEDVRVIVKYKAGNKENARGALRGHAAKFHHELDAQGAFAVTLPQQAIDALTRNGHIEYVEQDAPRYPLAQTVPYGIDLIKARDVWDADRNGSIDAGAPDGSGILVCVIDSGVRTAHEDFAGVNIVGGYPSGWNNDTCGHGSHVTGTIAAAHNSLGVVGVSPGKVSVYAVQVFSGSDCAWTYSSTLVDAANRCAAQGAKIISMSLGGGAASQTEQNAFNNLSANGVLSIAAAGNDGNTTKSYPASYPVVMSVAAVDANKAKASFSQYNSEVDISAPGVAVLSTVPWTGATASVGGTSYLVSAIENSAQASASGATVDGGLCTSTGAWSGKVVMCQRGTISFQDKVNNVQAGGGVATIIYNNVSGGFAGTMTSSAIPAVSMSMEDGQSIVASKLGQTATVNTISGPGSGYEAWDGTSMATPHVSGAAAVLWSANPSWTNTQIRQALEATAEDLGTAGRDNSFGYGLVNMPAALAYLQGGGNPPPATAPSNLTGTGTSGKGGKFNVSLNWANGGATVDVYRGTTKAASAIANTHAYSETLRVRGSGSVTYKVCNAGSTTACSNTVTLNY